MGLPLPVISPALAVLAAPPSRIAVANTVAAAVRNRMFPPEDDADGAETVLETGLSSTDERTACQEFSSQAVSNDPVAAIETATDIEKSLESRPGQGSLSSTRDIHARRCLSSTTSSAGSARSG